MTLGQACVALGITLPTSYDTAMAATLVRWPYVVFKALLIGAWMMGA